MKLDSYAAHLPGIVSVTDQHQNAVTKNKIVLDAVISVLECGCLIVFLKEVHALHVFCVECIGKALAVKVCSTDVLEGRGGADAE